MAGGEKILKNQRFFDQACRCALARIFARTHFTTLCHADLEKKRKRVERISAFGSTFCFVPLCTMMYILHTMTLYYALLRAMTCYYVLRRSTTSYQIILRISSTSRNIILSIFLGGSKK